MASQLPSVPEQFRTPADTAVEEFNVSELVSTDAGAHSPFGNLEFPVPYETLFYVHPNADDERPNFADGH